MIKCRILLIMLLASFSAFSQTIVKDSSGSSWSTHFQMTIISQQHLAFKSLYKGERSLTDTVEPIATSLTSTLFIGRKLWKGAAFYVNPEVSGGSGLSFAQGVAGALNGETYRVGATEPKVFVARGYLQQHIPLPNTKYEYTADDVNQVAAKLPTSRITISIGKFAISDFFDDNAYSKDPRTQFLNWSLWANGAWDYPANTRGYTFGLVTELIKPDWSVRLSSVAVPRIANASAMEYKFSKAHSETIEFKYKLSVNKRPGNISFIVFNTYSKAPSYADGLQALQNNNNFLLAVIQGNAEGRSYGGRKFGLGLNIDQQLGNNVGFFSRAGWNDGKYVSWAFTEIDKTISLGLSIKGTKWERPNDLLGIATVVNGISQQHRYFLKAGGYGFIIGDGKLDYGNENIVELFYSFHTLQKFWFSIDYQYVNHPAYNKDRGPVNVFGLRTHFEW